MNTVNNDVLNVLAQVYGDASLLGYSIIGDQYLMAYAIPVNVTDPYNEGQAVLSLMLDKGLSANKLCDIIRGVSSDCI